MSAALNCPLKSTSSMRVVATLRSLVAVLALAIITAPAAHAQTYKVIHNFTGGADGGTPAFGWGVDNAGSFYGATVGGGSSGKGTVFRLKQYASGWIFTPLHSFSGYSPGGGVAIYPDGTVLGVVEGTWEYGDDCSSNGYCGRIFQLAPSATAPTAALPHWYENTLHQFSGGDDGGNPEGDLTFDGAGNVYGVTFFGGSGGAGVAYELTPSNGGWTETALYSFSYDGPATYPVGNVVIDSSGNLYGVTSGARPHRTAWFTSCYSPKAVG